jgi:hypothetical protein
MGHKDTVTLQYFSTGVIARAIAQAGLLPIGFSSTIEIYPVKDEFG